jgi:predicted Co/Zn/Cd cation transporter (cation efflux family)
MAELQRAEVRINSDLIEASNYAPDVDVEATICHGGSVSATVARRKSWVEKTGCKAVNVYFEPEMLRRVNEATRSQMVRTSRQRWIMEAIVEKLQREEL